MLIIAERINATRKRVREALAARDAAFLQQEARRQADAPGCSDLAARA